MTVLQLTRLPKHYPSICGTKKRDDLGGPDCKTEAWPDIWVPHPATACKLTEVDRLFRIEVTVSAEEARSEYLTEVNKEEIPVAESPRVRDKRYMLVKNSKKAIT